MARQRIWAPWRLEYVKDAANDDASECVFCTAARESDDMESLILHRGEKCFVILNKFPYTNGHLMVTPYEHIATLPELPTEAAAEMMDLTRKSMTILEEAYGPDGFNLGMNQGRAAGAGVEHHIHFHVVPRWGGDTNFMPVLGDTRVMPQTPEQTLEMLSGKF